MHHCGRGALTLCLPEDTRLTVHRPVMVSHRQTRRTQLDANKRQVSTTESGLREMELMPCSFNHWAKSG